MAAPMLSTSQRKQSMKSQKQNKPSTRNVLASPYSVTWPDLPHNDHVAITNRLHATFQSVDIKREKLPWVRGKLKEERMKEAIQKRCSNENPKAKNLRDQLVIGVNAVTRSLERDQLRVVLVDRGTDPRLLVNHLLTLATTRDCPILLVNNLATTLAQCLQVSSLIALGFKKLDKEDDHSFDDLVGYLANKAVPCDSGWLGYINSTPAQTPESSSAGKPNQEQDTEQTPRQPSTVEIRANLPAIDFDNIYVKKSDSELVDGKVKSQDFGSLGFVAFEDSSGDEIVVCQREKTKNTKMRLQKSRKRKNERSLYESATVGKMVGNPDRPKQKKKKNKQ